MRVVVSARIVCSHLKWTAFRPVSSELRRGPGDGAHGKHFFTLKTARLGGVDHFLQRRDHLLADLGLRFDHLLVVKRVDRAELLGGNHCKFGFTIDCRSHVSLLENELKRTTESKLPAHKSCKIRRLESTKS